MIIVNFSTENYSRPQRRLINSLGDYPKLMFTDYAQIGSPTHQESPYEFKIYAIEKAFEQDDIVLWLDSSVYRVGDISVIENIVKETGFFGEEAGHWVGSWTNKHTRQYFDLTEEESKVPGGFFMFSAGILGLNKKSEVAMEFFKQWKASAKAGCFAGDWLDHRHDMTCASIIASRLGLKYQRGGSHCAYLGPGYSTPEQGVVFYLQGMP